jgi:hypothetical protein
VTKLTLGMPNWAELNSLIYMHTVVPNLRNLGLITERTADSYRSLGMLYEKSRATSASGLSLIA